MRIGLVLYGSLDTLSGGYLYDRKLVDYLHSQGDTVELVSIPWRNYPRHLGDNVSATLVAKMRRLRVDLLLQDELNHPSLFLLNRLLRKTLDIPFTGVVHHLRANEEHPRWVLPFYRWIERSYLRTLDAAVYNSETTCAAVARLSGNPLPGVVAYPAADHLAPPSPPILARIEQGAHKPTPLRLLSVGTVMPRKGIHHLLHALALLPAASWYLDVVGALDVAPVYVARLRSLIETLGVADRVKLHGRLSTEAVVQAYARSHALAMLSYEGFGIAFLEAMSFGLPVIAAAVGAAPELIVPGDNGFLVDPLDPVSVAEQVRSLCDPTRLAQMGLAARRRYDQHPTWAESGARARGFLLSLLEG